MNIVEVLNVVTSNVIPELMYTPVTNSITLEVHNIPTIPGVDWSIDGTLITWESLDYDIEIGDSIVVRYEYSTENYSNDGIGDKNKVITVEETVRVRSVNNLAKLMYTPIISSIILRLNGVEVSSELYSIDNRSILWGYIEAGYDIEVTDIVEVIYNYLV